MNACVKERLKTPPVSELLPESAPSPQRQWELVVSIELDSGPMLAKTMLKSITGTGLFSEQANMVFVQDNKSSSGTHVDVEGDVWPETAQFHIHIQDTETRLRAFYCSGTALRANEAYEGEWTLPCLEPETCDCGGMTGPFTLTALSR